MLGSPIREQSRLSAGFQLLATLVVGVAAFVWLDTRIPDPHADHDAARDLLMVRDCIDLHECHLLGPDSGVPALHQGTVWLGFLTIVAWFHGSTIAGRAIILLLHAAGVATVF